MMNLKPSVIFLTLISSLALNVDSYGQQILGGALDHFTMRPSHLHVAVTQAVQSDELAEAERLNGQVARLFGAGKYDEALPLAKRVLEISERNVGPNSKQVAFALNRLATLSFALKDYDQAKLNYRRSLAIYEKLNSANSLEVAKILDRLAFICLQKPRCDEAEPLYLRSLAIREALLKPGDVNILQSLYNLAAFYRSRGQFDKAVPINKRIVDIKENVLKVSDSEVGEALEDYRCMLRSARKDSETKLIEERISQLFYSPPEDKQDPSSLEIGKAIHLARPQLSPLMRMSRSFGTVRVRVLVDESGQVIKACAETDKAFLGEASEKAALESRYTPTLINGKPVKVIGRIVYKFDVRN
ncbi:MAG TPA: tetratricopeptide repeat protein [Pyrinomonadaceae bacterium]|nr:tetratricopeptide repeat protein [Pyrinomonadaceae bacterium]